MTAGSDAAGIRYLLAKKSVDDRALNRQVWRTLRFELGRTRRQCPLQVVEMGAGVGTMLQRAAAWGLAPDLRYTLVEQNPAYLAFAQGPGGTCTGMAVTRDTLCRDIYEVCDDPEHRGRWDLVMAHAVMDLLDAPRALDGFRGIVKPGGLLYLSINYDGRTRFFPPLDPAFEDLLMRRYHLSMDLRVIRGLTSGSSRTGRLLEQTFRRMGLPILASGRSDWQVTPADGAYALDEAYFLQAIVETVRLQLAADPSVDPERLERWARARQGQIASAVLSLEARNMDFLVGVPES